MLNRRHSLIPTAPCLAGFLLALAIFTGRTAAAEVAIESLSHNGLLTWTNTFLSVTNRVEWAATPDGPWHDSWASLTNLIITNPITSRPVPMFYRVVSTEPAPAFRTDISAQTALTLITTRTNNPTFMILDVRTSAEFATRHIRGALNIDLSLANFADRVETLDKTRTYLVYCASGSRSRIASTNMQSRGFQYLYNLSSGLPSFSSLSGAAPYLEP